MTCSSDAQRTAIQRLRTNLGITPQQAQLLLRLWRANGEAVAARDLFAVLPMIGLKRPDTRSPTYLTVVVCDLRKRTHPGIIETVHGFGYRLPTRGRSMVERALARESEAA